jgi:protein O-GlcNAc transferase
MTRQTLPKAATSNLDFQGALAALQRGNLKDAERLFKAVLRKTPRHVAALNLAGVVLTQLKHFAEAELYFRRALQEQPKSEATLYNYGIVLKVLNRPTEALERFDAALKINPSVAETWNNRGAVCSDLQRYDKAIADFDEAIALNPHYAEAFCNKGKSLFAINRYDDAIAAYNHALELKPNLAEAWLGRGNIFAKLNRYNQAFSAFERALAIKPDLAEVFLGRGNIFAKLNRYNEAFSAFERALAIKPDLAAAWVSRGTIFTKLNRYKEALSAYEKALAIKPDLDYVAGLRLHSKMHLCDWSNFDVDCSQLISSVRNAVAASDPSALLAFSSMPDDQAKCARLWSAKELSLSGNPIWGGRLYKHHRIRIAYVSADFDQHATPYLTAGMFEYHDKSRFEITAISIGPEDVSEMRRRLKTSFEHFIDVREFADDQIARQVNEAEIDILVDLNGYTQDARPGIFAQRCAPIQINYLGYPGTMGADCMDYIIADSTIIPEDHFAYYNEHVVWLPDTYQANDSKRPIANHRPTRAECGLPEIAFVFCCFNNSNKITPAIFDVWMRLLKAKKNSVLWLIGTNPMAERNLRREAEQRGILSDRLIFAPKMPPADHLARSGHADLFLDTVPYNAHTTGSDALWAGVPLLTCLGSTFASRVAASLLKAVGLEELITTSLRDYEALASKLASDPAYLRRLRERLAQNRTTHPLFDTGRFTRHIEAAYTTMWQRYQRGEAPKSFAVDPIGSNSMRQLD